MGREQDLYFSTLQPLERTRRTKLFMPPMAVRARDRWFYRSQGIVAMKVWPGAAEGRRPCARTRSLRRRDAPRRVRSISCRRPARLTQSSTCLACLRVAAKVAPWSSIAAGWWGSSLPATSAGLYRGHCRDAPQCVRKNASLDPRCVLTQRRADASMNLPPQSVLLPRNSDARVHDRGQRLSMRRWRRFSRPSRAQN
jgi:hypothetical protein